MPKDDDLNKEVDQIEKYGAKMIHLNHSLYPPLLKHVFNAPNVLLVKGNASLLGGVNFSVVGSRTPAVTSIYFTKQIVSKLANEGFSIVSGLATGIDAVAHTTALNSSSGTVAVIGNGLGYIYPKENKNLYSKIENENGVLVSEFKFGATPTPGRFPRRNATIAGMSYGTLIVEARKNSGSLITARYASSFNREVYAVPGFPSDERYAGTNSLIKHNVAKMTTDIGDIMDDMRGILGLSVQKVQEKSLYKELDFEQEINDNFDYNAKSEDTKESLVNLLSSTPVTIEQLCYCMPAIPIKTILIALLELEMENLVFRGFDGRLLKI
ncbi:MAG: DNA-protecting protein DprA [Alphaproteobacteria bacterium]|nr:DNA-protecting protein DprA [Rickettsiales bacterium]